MRPLGHRACHLGHGASQTAQVRDFIIVIDSTEPAATWYKGLKTKDKAMFDNKVL